MEFPLYEDVQQEVQRLLCAKYSYIDSSVTQTWQWEFKLLIIECVVMYNSSPCLFEQYKQSRLQSLDDSIHKMLPAVQSIFTGMLERRTQLWIIFEAIDRIV